MSSLDIMPALPSTSCLFLALILMHCILTSARACFLFESNDLSNHTPQPWSVDPFRDWLYVQLITDVLLASSSGSVRISNLRSIMKDKVRQSPLSTWVHSLAYCSTPI